MTTALRAIGFETTCASFAIDTHRIGVFIRRFDRAGRQILIHNGLHERTGTHCADFKQADLFARQTHLRHRVVNDYAQFGMKTDLKSVTHEKHQAPPGPSPEI